MKGLSAVALASLVAVGCDAPATRTSGNSLITANVDVGPGIPIDDDPIVSTTGINASEPAIAFDGANYLVVWSDARDHVRPDIWAARVRGDGSIIDTHAFSIAATPGPQMHPAVTWDGAQYVVVWEDFKIDVGATESDLRAALVSTTGNVTPLGSVSGSAASETVPAIDSNGSGALVTWIENGQVRGSMLSGSSFGAAFDVTTDSEVKKDPVIDSIPGGNYFVVYTRISSTADDDTYGQFVAPSSALVGGAVTISNGPVPTRNPSVSFDGTNFQVVFSSYYTGVDIYGTRVTTSGAVLESHLEWGAPVGGTLIYSGVNYQETPSIACTSGGCLVAWLDKRDLPSSGYDIYGQLLTTSMTKVGSDFAVSTAALSQLQVHVVASAGDYFVVWRDARAGGNAALKIGGTRVSTSGVVATPDGDLLDRGYNSQFGVALARNGSTLMLGWNDSRSLWGDDILSTRITTGGAFLDAGPRTVSDALHAQVATAIAAMGSQFLFAWSDNRSGHGTDVFVARAEAASGALIDPGGINVSAAYPENNVTPRIASNGTSSLVVWANRTTETFVVGAFVDGAGAVTPPFVISNDAGEQSRPSVAWSAEAGQYVVAWQDSRSASFDIYAARVTASGSVLDPNGVLVTGAAGKQTNPSLVAIGSDVFVVYQDDRDGNWNIYGTRLRVGTTVTVLDPNGIAITTDPGIQSAPSLAVSSSNNIVVAFNDERNTATNGSDIYGQIVTIAGALVGSNFEISATPSSELVGSLVDAGPTSMVVGYQAHRDDIHANRAMVRFVDIALSTDGCDQGCTPGYWKNHTNRWLGVAAADGYNATFGITSTLGATFRLIDAIKTNGGGERALARHATAGLLSSYGGVPNADGSVVQYPYSPTEVRGIVQVAYTTVDNPATSTNEHAAAIEAAKNQLAHANELGCPLTGTPATP